MNAKLDILQEIEKNSTFFQRVSQEQFKTRCPYCGDSDNIRHGHLYLKCSYDLNEPILYHCFLCNRSGKVNQKFLDRYGVKLKLPDTINYFNKISDMKSMKNIAEGTLNFNSREYKYLSNRLQASFTKEELGRLRIVWDVNNIRECLSSERVKNTLPSSMDGISFLSDNNALMLTRFYSGEPRWRKITLFPTASKSFYTIKKDLNLFQEKITVNISEGIFDAIGLFKHFPDEDALYVAVLGSDYATAIDYVISLGLFGNHIDVNLFLDSNIEHRSVIRDAKKYKWLFNKISVFKNSIDKDFGLPKDRIQLVEFTV